VNISNTDLSFFISKASLKINLKYLTPCVSNDILKIISFWRIMIIFANQNSNNVGHKTVFNSKLAYPPLYRVQGLNGILI
jgi:hypothetical protein